MESESNSNKNSITKATSLPSFAEAYYKSVLAGMAIAIAGTINLSVDNKYIGAFLFSFGLITIIIQNWWLYTGKIGIVVLPQGIPCLLITLLGNFLGADFIVASLVFTRVMPSLKEKVLPIAETKLNDNPLSIFLLAVFCGMMMYLAVEGYQKNKNLLMVIFPIMIFILCGFEHSIANMYYFLLAGIFTVKSVVYILIMIAGNTVGSLIMRLFISNS